ncbi:MAG: phage holin family protein [Chlamydiales bacterium]
MLIRQVTIIKISMIILFSILINIIAVWATGYILPGIHIKNFVTIILVAVIFGITNSTLRPILFILTLPINILTMGLFSFVIMGLIVYFVSMIVPGFIIDNFISAIFFSLIFSLIRSFLTFFTTPSHKF